MVTDTVQQTTYRTERLYRAARAESERYCRQLENNLGRPLGEKAISEWNQTYWWRWVCDRVLEHLTGEVYWEELEGNVFAAYQEHDEILDATVAEIDRIRARLAMNGRVPIAERQHLETRLADIINSLLA